MNRANTAFDKFKAEVKTHLVRRNLAMSGTFVDTLFEIDGNLIKNKFEALETPLAAAEAVEALFED